MLASYGSDTLLMPVRYLLRVDIICDQGSGADPSSVACGFLNYGGQSQSVFIQCYWGSMLGTDRAVLHLTCSIFEWKSGCVWGSKKEQSVSIHAHLWSLDWSSLSVGLWGLTQCGWMVNMDQRAGLNSTELILLIGRACNTWSMCFPFQKRDNNYFWRGIF